MRTYLWLLLVVFCPAAWAAEGAAAAPRGPKITAVPVPPADTPFDVRVPDGAEEGSASGIWWRQWHRLSMEDAHRIVEYADSRFGPYAFFGVYDGHAGAETAVEVANELHKLFARKLDEHEGNVPAALDDAFKTLDARLCSEKHKVRGSGSTAVVAIIKDGNIYVANAGDSRAVVMDDGEAQPLSRDFKATDLKEKARALAAGGMLIPGLLAVSRSFGDCDYKPGVTADPEVRTIALTRNTKFLILACDGVWDVLSNDEAVGVVDAELSHGKTPVQAARALVQSAMDKYTRDNVTALVVDLQRLATSLVHVPVARPAAAGPAPAPARAPESRPAPSPAPRPVAAPAPPAPVPAAPAVDEMARLRAEITSLRKQAEALYVSPIRQRYFNEALHAPDIATMRSYMPMLRSFARP